jgi:hypothetical protein
MPDLRTALAEALLDEILASLAEHRITPTPLNVVAVVTDRGGSDALASEVAQLLKQRVQIQEPAL